MTRKESGKCQPAAVSVVGDVVPKNTEKTKVLDDFFVSDFTGKLCSQAYQLPRANSSGGQ